MLSVNGNKVSAHGTITDLTTEFGIATRFILDVVEEDLGKETSIAIVHDIVDMVIEHDEFSHAEKNKRNKLMQAIAEFREMILENNKNSTDPQA